jgi:hypothetical protein
MTLYAVLHILVTFPTWRSFQEFSVLTVIGYR